MNTLTFTQLKKMTVTNLFPIFGKKATGHTFTREPDNKIYNMLNPEFEYNYGDVQVESPALPQILLPFPYWSGSLPFWRCLSHLCTNNTGKTKHWAAK